MSILVAIMFSCRMRLSSYWYDWLFTKGRALLLNGFNLSDDTVAKLQRKFFQFQNSRKIVHELLLDYVADYRQFLGSHDDRKEFLERQFRHRVPNFSHLISSDNQIFWHVSDIAIILGKNQSSISRTLSSIERSEDWNFRLIAIRKPVKSANGNSIFVYQQDIFDLIIDKYEEEYLLRFSSPRWGSKDNAPNLEEIKRFWNYLKDFYNLNDYATYNGKKLFQDIPQMSLNNILSLIWTKVFNFRISTISSVIFAVGFELARRLFGFHLWLAAIPAFISILCVILILKRKFTPDTLSNIGAGAFLISLLWISATLSVDRFHYQTSKQNIILTPVRSNNNSINFQINSNILNVKEFLYRISPDTSFHSTGFLQQINPNTNLPYPDMSIHNHLSSGRAEIDVKFVDDHDFESSVWHFSFDVPLELFKLNKYFILNSGMPWVSAEQYKIFTTGEVTSNASLSPFMFSKEIRSSIKHLLYGINKEIPDREVDFNNLDSYEPYVLFRTNDDSIRFVSSQIIFTDGSSSDIRISNIIKTIDWTSSTLFHNLYIIK